MLIFFTAILILGLLLGNSYSSSLASVLTIPQWVFFAQKFQLIIIELRYGKAIDTVEELAASKMKWGEIYENLSHFLIVTF